LQSTKGRVDEKPFVAVLRCLVAHREQSVCVIVPVYDPVVSGFRVRSPSEGPISQVVEPLKPPKLCGW